MKKVMSFLLSFVLLSSSVVCANGLEVNRIAGKDRYDTAIKVNQSLFDFNHFKGVAIVANGSDFSSALLGSYMASTIYAPFFLNEKHGVKTTTLDDMFRIGVNCVYIIGGYDKLDQSVENTFKAKGMQTKRITSMTDPNVNSFDSFIDGELFKYSKGQGFYDDFALLNYKQWGFERVILVNETKFPDLLSVIPFATKGYKEHYTALIPCASILKDAPKTVNSGAFSIIGGYNTIPKKIYTNRHKGAKAPLNRIAGSDRYETAVKIAEASNLAFKNKLSDTVVLVSGENYPDALSSGILAMYYNAPVLLTEKNRLNLYTRDYLVKNKVKNVIIIGGENSIGGNVLNELKALK